MADAPIFLMSFNRPDYLAQVLRSLLAQANTNIQERKVFLFQDGAVNPYSHKRHACDADINACVELFRRTIPRGIVMASPINLGVALNFDRAEKYGFEDLAAETAIFLEDDMVLGPHYIAILDKLIENFFLDERVGYLAAYGAHLKSVEEQRANKARLILLYHNWGFALYRRQWLKMRAHVNQYLELVKTVDYADRDHETIRALFASWGYGLPASSQDTAKTIACCMGQVVKINTYVCNALYIGERGVHMSPREFAERGYAKAVMLPERVTTFQALDDDLYAALLSEQRDWALGGQGSSRRVPTMERSAKLQSVGSPWSQSTDCDVTSSEEAFVRALYRVLLLREPDPIGLEHHLAAIRAGRSLEETFRACLRSGEFRSKVDRFIREYAQPRDIPLLEQDPLPQKTKKRLIRTKTATEIVDKLFGEDILATYNPVFSEDLQGWNSDHPIFRRLISHNTQIVFDVGVWKGASTIAFAKRFRELHVDGAVVAIDTFLGSPEHWNRDRADGIFKSLQMEYGYPRLYWQFMSNLKHQDCDKYVIPLAQTTENAAKILKEKGIIANLIHIDAAHEYDAVLRDAITYWDILKPGGFLVGDDYHSSWPGVVRAAGEFAKRVGLELKIDAPKWIIRKPDAHISYDASTNNTNQLLPDEIHN